MRHIFYILGFLLANFLASLQSGSFAKSGIKQIDSYKMPPVKTPTTTSKESLPKVLLPSQSWQIYPADDYDINTGVKKYSNSTRGKKPDSLNRWGMKRHDSLQFIILYTVKKSVYH
jgi:hypothetical protein